MLVYRLLAAQVDAAQAAERGVEEAGGAAAKWVPGLGPGWEVEWVNAAGESLLPFDVRLTGPPGSGPPGPEPSGSGAAPERGRAVVLVEVKTTTEREKRLFEVSLPELECARAYGERFLIARVFLAPGLEETCRVVVLKAPYRLLESHGADLLMRFYE